MRRLAVVAVASAALFAFTACSSSSGTADEPAQATPPVAAAPPGTSAAPDAPAPASAAPDGGGDAEAGDAALAADTEAICRQATTTGGNFAANYLKNLDAMIKAGSAADERATAQLGRDVANYAYALKDMARLTTDPALKKALGDAGGQVEKLTGDPTEIDEAKLAAVSATLDKVCG